MPSSAAFASRIRRLAESVARIVQSGSDAAEIHADLRVSVDREVQLRQRQARLDRERMRFRSHFQVQPRMCNRVFERKPEMDEVDQELV